MQEKEIEWRNRSGPTFVHPAAIDLRASKKSRATILCLITQTYLKPARDNKAQTEKDRR
jgi:hypothetical protein